MSIEGAAKGTVFTDGVFDFLHVNHISFLEEAAGFGDRLVVGVVSDAQTAAYKRRPIMSEDERVQMVEALACVDEAFIIKEALTPETMEQILAKYHVSAVVYAGDSTPEFYVPAERAGIMTRLPYRSGVSSRAVIERVIGRHLDDDL